MWGLRRLLRGNQWIRVKRIDACLALLGRKGGREGGGGQPVTSMREHSPLLLEIFNVRSLFYWNTMEIDIPNNARDTHGLRRSPTRANFQKRPRNLHSSETRWSKKCQWADYSASTSTHLPCSFGENSRSCREEQIGKRVICKTKLVVRLLNHHQFNTSTKRYCFSPFCFM